MAAGSSARDGGNGARGCPSRPGLLALLLAAFPACGAPVDPLPDDDATAADDDGGTDDDGTPDDDAAPPDDDATPPPDDDTTPAPDDDATPPPDDDATPPADDDSTPVSDDDATPVPDDDVVEPSCGDTTCDASESCWSCAADCGSCDCPIETEVVIYTQDSWNTLAEAFLADPSPCADYFISLPANSGDKTTPRSGGEPELMRERGPRFHGMAEFHWQTWEDEPGDWYSKGVEFRTRMEDAGYDVSAGDTWAINELPSTVRYDDAVRADALEAMRGLHDGPTGSPDKKGAVFIIGMGHGTTNFSVYKPYVQDWLEDADFWVGADLYARFWAQEVYTDPTYTCVEGVDTAVNSSHVNAYVQHFARHAEIGPDSANTAQSYLGRAYTPLMNAVWGATSGYGDTEIPLDAMKHFVSTQVYAARAWMNDHAYPDGRLGFAWSKTDGVVVDDLEEIATRLAQSIRYAYDEGGGSASHACSPSGAYTWCQCEVSGASWNEGWSTFDTW